MRWLVMSALIFSCGLVYAGGLQASFSGARDPCGTDSELVFCFDGEVDSSGNLVDKAGENLLTDRTEFDDWVQGGTCAVTADQWRNPVDGTKDADYLDNTGDSSGRRWISLGVSSASELSASVWIRADYDHTCTIRIEDGGGTIDEEDVWVTNVWKRFVLNGAGNNSGNVLMVVYPGDHGVAVGQAYFYGAQLVENDRWRTNQGEYLNPADQSIVKPDHDLAPTNGPTRALADVEYQGHRLKARLFDSASTQDYTKAYHASFDIFDSDHTFTAYVRATDYSYDQFLYKANNGGIDVSAQAASNWRARYWVGAAATNVDNGAVRPDDDLYHIVQLVRSSDTATLYVDGVGGTPVDVTGTGADENFALYVPYQSFDGEVAFAKLTARALSEDELAEERERIWSVYAGKGSALASWIISRSTVASKTFTSGAAHAINSKITEVAANIPRATLDGLLVEGQSTNFCDYSEEFDQWSTNNASVSADTDVALDGSTTADTVHEDATAGVIHNIETGLNISVTASSEYTASVWVKAINRNELSLQIQQAGGDALACFHLDTDSVSGTANLDSTWIEPHPGGYHRVAFSWTAPATETVRLKIYVEDSGCTRTFNGLDQDSFYLWGAQVEEGTFPTSYIETPGTSDVTRTADDITMFPVRFTGLPLDGSETMWIDFSQDPSGATITTSDGGYTLTKNGQPEHHRTEVFGDYQYFDGANDWWSRADDGSFESAGDFTLQAVIVSDDLSTNRIIMTKDDTAANRSWQLRISTNDVKFKIWKTGGAGSEVTANNVLEAGKPAFITAVYDYVTDGTSVMTLYVNGFATVSISNAEGPVGSTGSDFTIGAYDGGAQNWSGEILYCDYEESVLTEAQHDAHYSQIVQDYVLPKSFGGAGQPDKLTISFDVKCQWSAASDIGQTRDILEISGAMGTASGTRNRLTFEVVSAGRLYILFRDDSDVDHYIRTAVDPLSFDEWFGVWSVVDFSDLSRMDLWFRQGTTGDWTLATDKSGASGSASFDITDTKIRVGQDSAGTVEANCTFKNLSIRAEEIRP